MNALWYAHAIGDLYKILTVAKRDGLRVSFGWIPDGFIEEPNEQFDPVVMKQLFELGRGPFETGELWSPYPPYFASASASCRLAR